ncbi:hypothetical protein SDC9_141523 [bioreactor metagenome]|uniref:Uncharacterized protein n=1 Tax=bioreactor metagenome TaxID=1076179 RepID=A0A645DYB9_9ZZZZ
MDSLGNYTGTHTSALSLHNTFTAKKLHLAGNRHYCLVTAAAQSQIKTALRFLSQQKQVFFFTGYTDADCRRNFIADFNFPDFIKNIKLVLNAFLKRSLAETN